MNWRWDQGRLDYFKYENICNISKCLMDLGGVDLRSASGDPLREYLMAHTGLPFAPAHYRVWRNYGRVFACSLLAVSIGNTLIPTDICAKVATSGGEEFGIDGLTPMSCTDQSD